MTTKTDLEAKLEELWESCRTLQRDECGTLPAILLLEERFLAVVNGMAAEKVEMAKAKASESAPLTPQGPSWTFWSHLQAERKALEALKVSDPDQYQRRVDRAAAASEVPE